MKRAPALPHRLARLIAGLALLVAMPASANVAIDAGGWAASDGSVSYTEIVETVVDEGHGYAGDEDASSEADETTDGDMARYAAAGWDGEPVRPSARPMASVGPFHLVSADTIEMIGTVDAASPRQFATLMAAHPGVTRLVMVDCPGSVDEDANHVLARAVRRAGLETVVPPGGSIRSGAVDLFLAGVRRQAAPNAEFGIHSWRDDDGLEARDYAAGHPVHAQYLRYYAEMGMDEAAARSFYALTNSVGFDDVRYLGARDMARLGLVEVAG